MDVQTSAPPVQSSQGYSILVEEDNNIRMLMDSGALQHFVDNAILAGIEQHLLNYTVLRPPVRFNRAGGVRLGLGQGVLPVLGTDNLGRGPLWRLLSCRVWCATYFIGEREG